MTLYIQFQIVKELRHRNLERDYPERDEFLLSLTQCKFFQKVDRSELYTILDDIIGTDPKEHYIDYHEDYMGTKKRKRLAVTKRGRKFIRAFPFGFLEELAREYPFTLTVILAAIVGWVLNIAFQTVVVKF